MTEGDFEERRARMVSRLEREGRVSDERVFSALGAVPRHEFVPARQHDSAYTDRPLPIGEGQTISAPHMVAIMAELLDLDEGESVLEIGTGCGYHAAVTAELVGDDNASSVEYYPVLADAARERLDRLGYGIRVRTGDGHEGWPERAPFDAAYLTCAAPDGLPERVVEQLRPGGRIVGPVGNVRQTLVRAWKREDGSVEREEYGGVRFVPMQREE